MNDREKFEGFIKREGLLSNNQLEKDMGGGYISYETYVAWKSYQAAHAESAARIVSLQETIISLEQKLYKSVKLNVENAKLIPNVTERNIKIISIEGKTITNTGDKT